MDLKLEKVLCITYKDHIKAWLEKCLEKAVEHPLLRETLIQYLYLIKKLTHQTTNDKMKKELIDEILTNKVYIKSAFEIYNIWDQCQIAIIKSLENELNTWAKNRELEFDFEKTINIGTDGYGFWFYKKDWRFCIYFIFESKLEKMVVKIDHVSYDNKCSDEIVMKLQNHFNNFNSGNKIESSDLIWGAEFKVWEETSWENIKSDIPIAIEKMTEILVDKLVEFKA